MISLNHLPTLNATLNALSAVLLGTGYFFIRRKNISAHKRCMLSALTCSALFLAGYLTYHAYHGTTRFPGQGWARPVYFSILISHTFLAAAIVPLVAVTLYRALRGRFDRHKKIARWTLPLWFYVSLTGVLIYFFLYGWFPQPAA